MHHLTLNDGAPRVAHDPGPLAPALQWVDSRFGPIRFLSGRKHEHPQLGWWRYTCEISRPLAEVFGTADVMAFGASIDGSEALQKALGEAIERYIGHHSMIDAEREMIAVKDSALANRFPRCLPDEPAPEPFKHLLLDAAITHAPMRHLASDTTVWVPGGYVHLRFTPAEDEPMITDPVSTGLAFHTDLMRAIWLGLCETAERDAIMTFWWNQTPIPRLNIDLQAAPGALSERLTRIAAAGFEAHLFDMSTDFNVPLVFCLLEGNRHPFFAAGAACSADPYLACRKAIDEAVMVGNPGTALQEQPPMVSFTNFDWVKTFEDHKALYGHWQNSPALQFLLGSNKDERTLDDFANRNWWQMPSSMSDLRALAQDLEKEDLTVLWTEITTVEATHLGHCVKVVVPQMVPLSANHDARWLDCQRLNRLSPVRKTSAREFNPYPHPFA